jgi:hypothetical protein
MWDSLFKSKNGQDQVDVNAQQDLDDQLKDLSPGDALDIWGEGNRVVKTSFNCRELVDGRVYTWQWAFLDDDSLIEVSPDGIFRYTEHHVLKQASLAYEEIVAKDGALVRFEERVRNNESARRPVQITIDDHEYCITGTGTVAADRRGAEPALVPWSSFSLNPEENVYFGMYDVADEERVAVGLWTAHVCVSVGRAFDPSEVTEIYRNQEGKERR